MNRELVVAQLNGWHLEQLMLLIIIITVPPATTVITIINKNNTDCKIRAVHNIQKINVKLKEHVTNQI